jgi:signal transduction histidine kinase
VEDDLGAAFDVVTRQIQPEAEHASTALTALTGEVLFYTAREVVRNAARHGRPPEKAGRTASRSSHQRERDQAEGLNLVIEDDGVGLGPTEQLNEGSGRGLALHSTMMALIGAPLTVDSAIGKYTRVRLGIPGASSSNRPFAATSHWPGSPGPAPLSPLIPP